MTNNTNILQDNDCIFCKIIRKEISAKIVLDTDNILVFVDHNSQSDIHWLAVPKKHFVNLFDIDETSLSNLILDVKRFVLTLLPNNCKLIVNNGKEAGQEVNHLHLHFIAQTNVSTQ